MDHETNIKELKDRLKKFCEERDWDQFHNAKDLAISMVIEASELLEHFRFKSQEEVDEMFKNEKKREEISGEVSDVLYHLLRLSQKYDIDLVTEFNKKMEKTEKRYPIDKFKGNNKKYNELD